MAHLADTLTTRDAVRRATADDIIGRCQAAATAIEGGALDGVEVVSLGVLRDQVTASLLVKLPPPSAKHAEVRTPAVITVSAICPECTLPVEIIVNLGPSLSVDNDGAELSVKAKSKARVHVHGQLSLPEADEDQEDFGLDDIAGPVPTIEELETALLLVLPDDLAPVPSTVAMEAWSDLEKRQAMEWAIAVHLVASDNDDVVVPARPAILGGVDPEGEADGGVAVEPDPDAPTGNGNALECVGSNHVPGCEHTGEVRKRRVRA